MGNIIIGIILVGFVVGAVLLSRAQKESEKKANWAYENSIQGPHVETESERAALFLIGKCISGVIALVLLIVLIVRIV